MKGPGQGLGSFKTIRKMGKVHGFIAYNRLRRKVESFLPENRMVSVQSQLAKLPAGKLEWIEKNLAGCETYADLMELVRESRREAASDYRASRAADGQGMQTARVVPALARVIGYNM